MFYLNAILVCCMGEVAVGKYWENFGARGYAWENYLRGIETVDKLSRPAMASAVHRAMDLAGIQPRSGKLALDFCGGGLPVGPAASVELLSDGGTSLWTDRSPQGIWLATRTIAKGQRWAAGEPADWDEANWEWTKQEAHYEKSGFGKNPMLRACRLGKAAFLDIDCPPEDYSDVSTNLCGTESSTDDRDQYEFRARAWARSIKPGGLAIRTLSSNSSSYLAGKDSAGNQVRCPAVPVTIEAECELLDDLIEFVDMGLAPADPEEMGAHTWDGVGWAVGIRR
jgi:hypothetical protein